MHADATISSVTVAMNVSISLTANSPYASCSASAQAALLQVGGQVHGAGINEESPYWYACCSAP